MPPSTNDKFNQYRKRNPKIKLLNNILNRFSPLIGFTGLTGIALFYMSKFSSLWYSWRIGDATLTNIFQLKSNLP